VAREKERNAAESWPRKTIRANARARLFTTKSASHFAIQALDAAIALTILIFMIAILAGLKAILAYLSAIGPAEGHFGNRTNRASD
jgi:hypothetical protein